MANNLDQVQPLDWAEQAKQNTETTCNKVNNDPNWSDRCNNYLKNSPVFQKAVEQKQPKPLYSIVDGIPQLNHQPGNPDEEALSKAVFEARTSGRATGLQEAIALINAANAPKQQSQELRGTSEASSMYNSPLYAKQNAQPKPQHTSSSEGQKNSADLQVLAMTKVSSLVPWLSKHGITANSKEVQDLKTALQQINTPTWLDRKFPLDYYAKANITKIANIRDKTLSDNISVRDLKTYLQA